VVGRNLEELYPDFCPSRIELPVACGQVDVGFALSEDYKSMLQDMDAMFPLGHRYVPRAATSRGFRRCDYGDYVARQVSSGRVRLSYAAGGAADVFVVRRTDVFHKHAIWNGSAISQAAALCLSVALFPLWLFSLRRPWSTDVLATDASPSYGFGERLAHVRPSAARCARRFDEETPKRSGAPTSAETGGR
jgi:hypothetical protein